MIRRLLVAVLLVGLVAPAGAAVADEPRFELDVSDRGVRAGTTGEVTMVLRNDAVDPGETVAAASDIEVSVGGDGPIEVESPSQGIGNLSDGEARAFTVVLDVPSNTPGGVYRLPARVNYTANGTRGSTVLAAPVRVRPQQPDFEEPRFELSVPEPELRPGTAQGVTIELRNDAEDRDDTVETARDVNVTVAGTGPIEVDSGPRWLGDVPDGVPQPITVTLDVPTDAPGGRYRLPVRVEYGDADGDDESATLHATVRVERRARFEVTTNETTARIGGDGDLRVDVTNVGERPAETARLTLTADSPVLDFESAPAASRFLGRLDAGERRTVAFDLSVGESAARSTYSLDATVGYRTTDGAIARSRTLTTGVAPLAEQTFGIEARNGSVRVGEEGTVGVAVTNRGPEPVRNGVVTLSTGTGVVPLETEVAIGDLAPGETRTVSFDVRAEESAVEGDRQFEARVRYRDADDEVRQSDAADIPVTVRPDRSFAATVADARLRAGQEGTVTVTVTNEGPGAARHAVVTLATGNRDLTLLESEVALGRLPAGETREVTFDVEVTDDAAAGSRQLDTRVTYRTADGAERRSDSLPVRANVTGRRSDFQVESETATVAPGGTAIVDVVVTNRRGEPMEDVSAKVFTDTPLSSSIGDGFIDRLGPNESATLRFEITAAASAIPGNSYPLEMDFQFDTPGGDTLISDTYRAPVRIEAPDRDGGDGLPVAPIAGAVVVLLVVGAGILYYRRRE